jgi:hypothetical protein
MVEGLRRTCESESCGKPGVLRIFTDYSDTARCPRIDVWLCEHHYLLLMNQEPVMKSWFKHVLARKQEAYR